VHLFGLRLVLEIITEGSISNHALRQNIALHISVSRRSMRVFNKIGDASVISGCHL